MSCEPLWKRERRPGKDAGRRNQIVWSLWSQETGLVTRVGLNLRPRPDLPGRVHRVEELGRRDVLEALIVGVILEVTGPAASTRTHGAPELLSDGSVDEQVIEIVAIPPIEVLHVEGVSKAQVWPRLILALSNKPPPSTAVRFRSQLPSLFVQSTG